MTADLFEYIDLQQRYDIDHMLRKPGVTSLAEELRGRAAGYFQIDFQGSDFELHVYR
jgi:hypothetical protein